MDIFQSETNRGKKSLLFDDTYRLSNILKNGDKSYRCTKNKSCKVRITTDADSKTTVKTLNEHNHGVDPQKTESQQLRIRVRKASGDIPARPSKIIRTELQGIVKYVIKN